MQQRRGRQRGFSILAAVVAAVVLGVIGTATWLMYQHNRPTIGMAGDSQTANQQAVSKTPATTYLTIGEWGIRAPYAGSLKLTYTMSADGTTAIFSSDQLTAVSSDCIGKGGFIVRYSPTDDAYPHQQGLTVEQYAGQHPGSYAHVGNYYYRFAHSQSACEDISTSASLESQTNDAVKALVANLQAIPN